MTAKGANTGQKAAKKTFWSRKKSLMQYPGGVAGQNTFGSSARLIAEEMNTLSYLVRKYPQEAMLHLSSVSLLKELADRQQESYRNFIVSETIRLGIIQLTDGAVISKEDSDCGNTQT